MAIALRATGAWAATANANQTVSIPAGALAGDLMVMFYGTKPFSDNPTINQLWNNGGAATDGTIAAGNDVGSMQSRIFWKIHTGTETNPTVNNGTNNVSSAVIVVFSKDALKDWELEFGGGGDNTAGTAFSATTPSLDLTTDDVVAAFCAIRSNDGSPGVPTLTATGMTFSAFSSQPATAFTTTTGGDMAARSGFSTITAGTATTPITFASTLAAAHTGAMYVVRMRELDVVATSFDPMGMMGFFGI
jgi:hypothetical protein